MNPVFLLIMTLYVFLPQHAIYVSTCEIKIENDLEWHGVINVFYDDLEDGILNQTGRRPNLSISTFANYKTEIENYLSIIF